MMAPTSFRSIYLEESGQISIQKVEEAYMPTGSQSRVAVKYSGVCPGDVRHFYMGWNSYNLGYEFIGTVEATGPESPYRVGEMVFGHAKFGHRRPNYLGSHQDYLIADTLGTFRVPRDMLFRGGSDSERKEAWTQVVSWPAAALTASDMLFNCLDFSFPGVPGLEKGADPKGRAILIWGGAGAVGLATIQIAKTAGFSPIYTTASPHNHAALLELGATQAFDYRSPTVVDEIHAAVAASGKVLSVVADAVTAGTGFGEPPSSVPRDISRSSPFMAKQTLTKAAADVRLVATLVVDFDPDWKFCVSLRDADMFPDAADYRARTQAAVEWLLENHRNIRFRIPNVRVVKGAEEGVRAIRDVYEGKVSMEKVVIEHPM